MKRPSFTTRVLFAVASGLFVFTTSSPARGQKQAVRALPLVIEGKKEKSAIETMELTPLELERENSAPQQHVRFEEPYALLEEPEVLLGIPEKGLPIETNPNPKQ